MNALKRLVILVPLFSTLTAHAASGELVTIPSSAVPLDASIAQLTHEASALSLALPEGQRITFRTRTEQLAARMTGVIGHSTGSDRLAMFIAGDRISGDVYATGGHYRLFASSGSYWWAPVRDLPREVPRSYRLRPELTDAVAPVRPAAMPLPALRTAAPGPDGNYQIDLLLIYTPLYEQRYRGREGTVAEATRLIFLANSYFENTAMPVRYRLLGVEKYTGISEDYWFERDLNVIARDAAVQTYRTRIGADVVALLRTFDNADMCGLARYFDVGDHANPPQSVDPDYGAFAVAGMGPDENGLRCEDQTLAHELGHVLSGGHNFKEAPIPNAYWQPYSRGWECGIADPGSGLRYYSIMSYGTLNFEVCPTPPSPLPTCQLLGDAAGDFFSSPALTLDGQPCGSAGIPGLEPTQADNARSITEAAPYVAAYRDAR